MKCCFIEPSACHLLLLQKRSEALDHLHDSLQKVADKAQLLPQLPQLMVFMQQLLLDHNFRVSLSALQMLGELAGILQSTVATQLRWVPEGRMQAC